MAYTKQNFKPEQVLTAAELNAMDEQIRLNDEKLQNMESSLATKDELNAKQDKISDLDTIRQGATLGASAIQSVKTINGESILGEGNITIEGGTVDLSGYAKKSELPTKVSELDNDSKYTTETWVTGKIAEAQLGGGDGEVVIPVKDVQIDSRSIVNSDGIAIINSSEFKGEKGDTGETGPQGPQGEKGEDGQDGAPGKDGINGKDTEIAYLDNPMDSVLLDANGEATAGFPCTTNLYVYVGTQKAKLKSVEYTVEDAEKDGLVAQFELNDDKDCGTFSVSALAKTSNSKVSFRLKAITEDNSEYESVYLINKISASAPNIVVDLTNDNVNIPCDANKNILDGYNKITNGINVFEGATQLSIDAVEVLNNTEPIAVEFIPGDKSFKIPNLPVFDDILDLTVNVTFKNVACDTITRTTGFRVIKVVPGAAGEAAEFFEILPNFNTINVGRDIDGNQYIKNEEFIPSVMHVKGNSRVLFDATSSALTNYGLTLKYAVDADADNNSTIFSETGVLNLKNAITGDLDLDRYISLALIKNNEVIDFEKIYMIHDGAPGKDGVSYKLSASKTVIQKDNTGAIKDKTSIYITLTKCDGSDKCENITNAVINNDPTYSAYDIAYSIDNGTEAKVVNIAQLSIIDRGSGIFFSNINNFITYKLYYTQTGTGSPILIDSVTINVVQDGANGVDGKMMYFDGEFATTKTYVPTEKALPYVYDDSGIKVYNDKTAAKYFYLRADSYGQSETTPYKNYMDNKEDNRHSWEPIESMDVLYSKIGLFETANVGPAVFYGDYVFSQTSINGGNNFNDFDGNPIEGAFKPAVWFNFKTGEGSLANGNIYWDKNGNVEFGPGAKLEWNSDWDQEATRITQDTISTYEITAKNIKGGKLKADLIDVENLTVNKLDTAPSVTGNKVIVEDNVVKVINDNGDENVILSNNVIGNINTNTFVNDSTTALDLKEVVAIEWNTTSQRISKYGNTNILGATGIIKPSIDLPSKHFYIGLVNKDGVITFYNQVYLLKSTKDLPYNFSYDDIIYPKVYPIPAGSSGKKWKIDNTYSEDTASLSIYIECYNNETKEWKNVATLTSGTSGNEWNTTKDEIPGMSHNLTKDTCYQSTIQYKPEKRGIYRAQIKFLPGCVNTLNCIDSATTMTNATRMLFAPYYEVNRNFKNTNFTEIGKNGIVIKGNENVFVIDDNEITMSNATYGLKLNSAGFYRWDNDLKDWKELDLRILDKK